MVSFKSGSETKNNHEYAPPHHRIKQDDQCPFNFGFTHHAVEQAQIALVPRSVNHTRTQNIYFVLALGSWL